VMGDAEVKYYSHWKSDATTIFPATKMTMATIATFNTTGATMNATSSTTTAASTIIVVSAEAVTTTAMVDSFNDEMGYYILVHN
jgi:hypothetical protein